jgi:hypothetical protein
LDDQNKDVVAFDTGAQLFRIRDEEFMGLVGKWIDRNQVDEWGKGPPIVEDLAGFMKDWANGTVERPRKASDEKAMDIGFEGKTCRISGTVDSNVKYYWRGEQGMNGYAKRLAAEAEGMGVKVECGVEVIPSLVLFARRALTRL